MIFGFILVLSILVLFTWPKQSFWLCVLAISDPGGIIGATFSKGALGGVFSSDIFLVLIWAIFILRGIGFKEYSTNYRVKSIFRVLLIISLYKAVVWGLIIPDIEFSNYFRFVLVRERDAFYGFLILIPVFLSALQDMDEIINILVIPVTIILILTVVSMFFGLDIIRISSVERYKDSGIMRMILDNYGLLNLLLPLSLYAYINKIKIKYGSILYLGGILAFINILVTITKNVYLNVTGIVIAVFWLSSKLFKSRLSGTFLKGFIALAIAGAVLSVIFPNYLNYAFLAFQDIFFLVSEGQTKGGSSSRMWQIPAFLYEIQRNPLFGTGFGYDQLSKQFDINQFDATDFPLLAHVMQYGLVGVGIYISYYFKLYKVTKEVIYNLQKIDVNKLLVDYKYEVLWAVASISFFVGYFVRFYTIFIELTRGSNRIEMTIYTAVLLACAERIRAKMHKSNPGSQIATIKKEHQW